MKNKAFLEGPEKGHATGASYLRCPETKFLSDL
jgi:hypothetical protein